MIPESRATSAGSNRAPTALAWRGAILACACCALTGAAHAEPPPTAVGSFELAARYENGEGVARDMERAIGLYCEAVRQGDTRAYFALGWVHLNGRGVPRDDGMAVGWFKKAAESGNPQARNLLRALASVAPRADDRCDPPVARAAKRRAPTPEIRGIVQHVARQYGVDAHLVLAVIEAESDFDPHAVSPRNARGLMQLLPSTADRFGVADPFDPEQNVRGGTAYLRWLLERFDGDLELVLAAYNAGEGQVSIYGGVPPFRETTDYVAKVNRLYRQQWKRPSAALMHR